MSRPTMRRTPRLENLEARQLLTAGTTEYQQLALELINEALTDPGAAALRVEQGLTTWAVSAIKKDGDTVEGVIAEIAEAQPRPPVAWDADLARAAETHTDYQIGLGAQTHDGPRGLETASKRVVAAGYDRPAAVAENIIYGVDSPEHAMRAFLADYGKSNASDPHRETIQQTNPNKPSHQDVGVAVVPVEVAVDAGSPFVGSSPKTETKLVVTQVFGRKDEVTPKLLGVVYDDADGDRFYDPGEGVGGAKVTITNKATGASTNVTTWASGGYQAEVQPGDYQVEVRLGDRLLGRGSTAVGRENTKLDFRVNGAPKVSEPPASLTPVRRVTTSTPSASSKEKTTSPATALAAPKPRAADETPTSPPSLPTTPVVAPATPAAKPAPAPASIASPALAVTENLKAIDRLKNLASRSADSAGGTAAMALLRSSLSGTLRSWKLGDAPSAELVGSSR